MVADAESTIASSNNQQRWSLAVVDSVLFRADTSGRIGAAKEATSTKQEKDGDASNVVSEEPNADNF